MSLTEAEREYNRIILSARNQISGGNSEMRKVYIRIYEAVAEGLLRINQDVGSGKITDVRAVKLRENLLSLVQRLGIEVKGIIGDSIDTGIRIVRDSHIAGTAKVSEIMGVRSTFPPLPNLHDSALSQYLIRRGLAPEYNYKTLIDLDIKDLNRAVERTISSGIARGISPDRLTRELTLTMSQNDPEFQKVLKNLGPKGGKLIASLEDLDPDQVVRAKSFIKSAKRIAVTEVANATFEADRIATLNSPVIGYVKWEVSGRHYGLPTSPDSCTFNHEQDQYNKGAGVFYPDTVPPLQHPFCGCFTSKVLRDPDTWDQPKPEPVKPKSYDEQGLRRFYKGKSTAHRERNVQRTNKLNRLAWMAYNGEI